MENIFPIFKSAVTIMTPLLFAAAGGLYPALAGTMNITLEGLLLAGAFSSLAVFYFTGSAVIAVIAAVIAATALSLIHALAVFKLKADLFITGLAVNLFSGGLCIVLSDKLFNTRGVTASNIIFGLVNWYFPAALLLLLISWLVIFKTPFGYRLRACEKDSDALLSLGIKPQNYKTCAFLISGFLCGIGGSFLSLNLGVFIPGMSAGKGWIALVVIFLGARKPQGILIAAFIFGLTDAFSNYAQGFLSLPSDIILSIPYIVTFIAMVAASIIPQDKRSIKG